MPTPRKPPHLRALHGDRPASTPEPQRPPWVDEPPEPPRGMSKQARSVWDRVLPDLLAARQVIRLDADVLARYCENVALLRALQRAHDRLAAESTEAWRIRRDMRATDEIARKLATALGATPAARRGVTLTEPPRPRSSRPLSESWRDHI